MTSERLYEFWVPSKTLDFSRASERLFMNQSLLSRHISAIERELNTALFVRDSHSVVLTEAGKMLAQQAEEIIGRCDQAERLIRRGDVASGGCLRVACGLELSYASHIRSFLRRFMARYPEIDLSFEVIPGSMPESLLDDYDLVISLCHYLRPGSDVRCTLIQNHGTYIYLPPGHPMVSRSMISLGQLDSETLIVPYASELFGPYAQNAQLAEHSARGRLTPVPVANLSTALFMVSCGQGILIGPRYVRSMVSPEILSVNILDQGCRFGEYIYRHDNYNETARLFEAEFLDEFLSASPAAQRNSKT